VDALARRLFRSEAARALLASGTSHGDLSVATAGSTPAALVLAMAAQHANMPVPVGGAGRLAEALVSCVSEAGGTVLTGREVARVVVEDGTAVGVETATGETVRARRAVVADLAPGPLFSRLVGEQHLPSHFLQGLRFFRHGSGLFKLDLALDGPVPWSGPDLDRCGVVHLTGDLDTMVRSAAEVHRGALPARPLLVVGQQSVVDPTRAPAGCHTLWVETHVPTAPRGDGADELAAGSWDLVGPPFTERVLDRLEDHAPGLRSRIVGLARHTPVELEAANPNLVGGDLGGGSSALDQQLVFRPVPGWFRYATPVRGLYLCSASTHPGGGVHGMGGRNCAQRVLRDGRLQRMGLRRR
jgi:phytoene dehydrogenase-like protein